MLVRDEADIIGQCLDHLLTWVDALYIFDTGSTDGTWEIIREAASRETRIVLFRSQPVAFCQGLRAVLFDHYRSRFKKGDWIARVDADEFYHIPPPQFIKERIRPWEAFIRAQMYDFVLLTSDLEAWTRGDESLADRARPIELRRRHYIINAFPEGRLFRYRPSMRWPITTIQPRRPGLVAIERIPIRHYRWRDPLQAQRRTSLRSAMLPHLIHGGAHWRIDHWTNALFAPGDPALHQWSPGQPLLPVHDRTHLRSRAFRIAQHAAYRSGLVSFLDRFYPRSNPEAALQPLSPEFNQSLASTA